MASVHTGNMLNAITFEEHDGELNAKKVSLVSGATIYAVVNTSAVGQASVVLDSGISNIGFATVSVSNPTLYAVVNTAAAGISNSIVTVANRVDLNSNITLNASPNFIGLVTVANRVDLNSNITLNASPNFIGLVTVANTVSTSFSGNVTLDDGSLTGIIGNVTITDSKGFIGLTTTTLGASPAFIGHVTVANRLDLNSNVTLNASPNFIGLVTIANRVDLVSNVTLNAGANYIGLASVNIGGGNVGLNAGVNNIGFASVTPVTAWPDPKTYIGLVTVGGMSTVTLSDPKGFIGLVTAVSLNAGSNKTLIHKNIELTTASIATIAVPSNTFYMTNLVINSDATVRMSIKSGATYLTGNASIGITLNPGGGWVETGSVDSPTYYGLAGQAAIVVEKFDMTATSAKVGGKLIYFDQ